MKLSCTFLLALLPGLAPGIAGADHEMTPVTDGVYVFLSSDPGIGNAVAVVTDVDVFVIDTGATPSGARQMIADIRSVTTKPVGVVINTHWHDDHIWGNQAFAAAYPDVKIIAHENTRRDIEEKAVPALGGNIERMKQKIRERSVMVETGKDPDGNPIESGKLEQMANRIAMFKQVVADFETIEPTLPTLLIREDMHLERETNAITIRVLGHGHTEGDLVVLVPEQGVLIAGDLVTRPIPSGAYPVAWLKSIKALAETKAKIVVPGHGAVLTDLDYVEQTGELLEAVVSQVGEAMERGMSLEETQEKIDVKTWRDRLAGEDPRLGFAFDNFFLKLAVEGAYAELDTGD